jgi:hypothetical protein
LAALIFAGYLVYITLARPNSTDFMAEYGPAAGNRSRPNPYAIRQRPRHATSMWPNRYDLG